MLQGQDGVDLEMNLNGSRSITEDEDLDNIVCVSFESSPVHLVKLITRSIKSNDLFTPNSLYSLSDLL